MNEIMHAPAAAFDGWPEAIRMELESGTMNPRVGTRLLSENGRVRVWEVRLAPGERIGFHRHVLDYFWTAVTPGRALSRQGDGTQVEAVYTAGQTQHSVYERGDAKVHDLENIGDTELVFTTVEFLDSANTPMALSSTREDRV
jgi:quercetin dioxygenase-like cupin family protein